MKLLKKYATEPRCWLIVQTTLHLISSVVIQHLDSVLGWRDFQCTV